MSACPTGAIGADGHFNLSAGYTHNYREFMGGFTNWIEQIADSRTALDYRAKVSDPESASVWQSLSYGANYKAAYCLAVCPAGEDVIAPFLQNRKVFTAEVVKPLQDKPETVVRSFAGPDYERAVVPPEARQLLMRFDKRSAHYTVAESNRRTLHAK